MIELLKKLWGNWYFRIGLLALICRLVLMPLAAHADLWSISFARYFFVEKKVLNIWDYFGSLSLLPNHPLTHNYGSNFYTYPPLAYFTIGFLGLFTQPFFTKGFMFWAIENYPRLYENPLMFRHLVLLKFPYLLFDFGIAYFLVKFFETEREKRRIYLLWLFNPLSFYSTYLMGQFELMPIFWVILALYLSKMGRKSWAAVSLGVGGGYKMFPLFFLPILAVKLGKTVKEKIKLFLLGLLPFFLSIAPFLGSAYFRQDVLFSPQSQKFMHLTLMISGAEGIALFVFFWGLIFFASCFEKSEKPLWLYFLAVMLLFFGVTHYHPQWFIWLTPLLMIELMKSKFKTTLLTLVMFISWVIITLFFESSLNYGMFVPLWPALWDAPSLAVWFSRFYDVFQLKTIVRSLFAAASVAMIYFSWRRTENEA